MSSLTTYETGATRSADASETRYDLVPAEGIEAVARAMYEGSVSIEIKRGVFNERLD